MRIHSPVLLFSVVSVIIAFPMFDIAAMYGMESGNEPNTSFYDDSAHAMIDTIEIVRFDIFETPAGQLKWIQELANRFHIRSRHSIIERELLFRKGDRFRPELLEESERNLRRLQFLGEISVTADNSDCGTRDVTVITHDQWSTILDASAGREGGRNEFRLGVMEQNFGGYGKNLGVNYKIQDTGNYLMAEFDDMRFFSSRFEFHLKKIQGEDRNFFISQFFRPLYSLDARWSLGFEVFAGSGKSRWYHDGKEIDTFRSKGDAVELLLLRSFGSRYKKLNAWLTYNYYNGEFSPYEFTRNHSLITPDDNYHKIGIGVKRDYISFIEERQIDKFQRVEDMQLGSQLYGEASLGIRISNAKILRSNKFIFFEIGHNRSIAFCNRQYFISSGSISSRYESHSLSHTITSLDIKYYNKMLPSQTIAGHAEMQYGKNLDRGWQYILGEDQGLRGYPSFRFSGQKFFLINLEDRIFTPWEILWTGIGASVFMDGGYVWKSSEPIRFRDIHWSAGLGLRLGLNKSSGSRVVRMDISRAFDGSGYLFSISTDQVFSFDRIREKFKLPGMIF